VVADGETGLLVRPFDTKEMAAAIESLAHNLPKKTQMGVAARLWAVRQFSPAKIASMYERAYEEVLNHGAVGG